MRSAFILHLDCNKLPDYNLKNRKFIFIKIMYYFYSLNLFSWFRFFLRTYALITNRFRFNT